MPYRRRHSSYWQIDRILPGYGPTGQLSTRVKDRRLAVRMEAALTDLAEKAITDPRWHQLLVAIVERRVTLLELMEARANKRLEALARSLSDPLLSEVAVHVEMDRATKNGLVHIYDFAGSDARLSALLTPESILACLRHAEASGMKRNSVRRQVYRALSKIIRHALGSAERDRIFAEVDYPSEDDTREVILSREEIASLLRACESVQPHGPELRVFVLTAMLTGADRGVLLAGKNSDGVRRGLLVRDVAIFDTGGILHGEISLLHDSKTSGRARTVGIGPALAEPLLALCQGKRPDDPVFPITWGGVDYIWKKALAVAGFDNLRIKDLRAQFAIYADKAGVATATISKAMGHKHESMTARYQRHDAALSLDDLQRIEASILRAA
jgi:integrase